MSNFTAKYRNKKIGEIETVTCMDDYFGRNRYGYAFKDGSVLTVDELNRDWERVEDG